MSEAAEARLRVLFRKFRFTAAEQQHLLSLASKTPPKLRRVRVQPWLIAPDPREGRKPR